MIKPDSTVPPLAAKPALQGFHILRALSMLMVFYCHMPSIPSVRDFVHFPLGTSQAGAIAVSVFFVVSGFAMAYNHSEESFSDWRTWGRMFWRRLAKFYPTAVVVTILSLPLAFVGGFRERVSPISVLANLLLLQAWHLTWNLSGVVWFLSVLLFCYAMFPVILQIIHRLGRTSCLVLLFGIWLGGIVGTVYNSNSSVFFKSFPPYRLYEFVCGVLLGLESVKAQDKQTRGVNWFLFVFGLIWIFGFVALQNWIPRASSIAFYTIWTPGTLSLVESFSGPDLKLNNRILARFVVFLSGISFPFYMFHQVTLRYVHSALYVFHLEGSLVFGAAAVLIVFLLMLIWCPFWNRKLLPFLADRFRCLNPI